ncbi:uncharacterized protein J7T54_001075 [Emericellopsis cladophorae]|uniref:Cytochrome c oxidase subunit 6B-like protein new16 n=1 Tax=Emericellopsis cladophorae TaxID=2686198 RepID=A0A9Q0BCF5_9HYPO|nr:uncharacterized protein J7T54_001075 [Emericellopsis cladophorae]KAI6780767.1 hypothetical protein J7T54_001075 [Emericellopsis cladophorae]
MGWFSSDSRGEAIRAGTAIPTRSERQVCWAARDNYFACLDAHKIDDPLKDPATTDKKLCKAESTQLDQDCAKEWVKYFKQWRVADLQKRRRLDELRRQGAQEMTVTSTFAPEGGVAEKGKGKDDIQGLLEKRQR